MIKQYEKNGKKFYKFRNIYIGIDPLTGKEIRKSKAGFKTKREAEIYISKLRTEYDNNNYINSADITFNELYQMWYASYKDTVKPSSCHWNNITNNSGWFPKYKSQKNNNGLLSKNNKQVC